jgi:Na+/melibiose symporter-like transporter
VVPADSLARANSLLGVADAVARLGGAPVGGLLYAAGGLPTVVVTDSGTFLAAAALAALIRLPAATQTARSARPSDDAGFRAGWVDGMRLVVRSRALSTVLGASALSQVAQGIFLVMFVVFVRRSLHGGGGDVGLLRGVQAVGAVAGGLSLGLLARRIRPEAMFGYSLVVFGLLSAVQWNLPAVSTWIGWYAALFALAGIPAVALSAGGLTVAQTLLPASHLGRVAGIYDSTTSACGLLGVLLAGVLGQRLPLGALLTVQASINLAAGLASVALLGPAVRVVRRPLPVPAPAQSATG